ncbi:MAG: ribonuclease P [Thaumarchaeota archaeon]|nr:MAG: ribonuclease P [Nitrososphaerota archaeon]
MRDYRKIALDRIARLMEFAKRHAVERPELAREAGKLVLRIARKARIRIPIQYKRFICRKCGTPFYIPGSFTVRVRDRRSTHVVIKCNTCGYVKRIPAVREKKLRRRVASS